MAEGARLITGAAASVSSPLTAQSLVRDSVELRSLPATYRRVVAAVKHPLCSAADVGRIVSEDPALTARLLGLVNSAFLGYPGKIDTVTRAITVLGTEQLCELALATSVVEVFEGFEPGLLEMKAFWRHSLAVAVFARALGVHLHERNAERLFVAGLLHDIGSLILYSRAPREAARALERAKEGRLEFHHAEREVLGFDHAEVGFELLAGWHLPTTLQLAVRHHHKPSAADPDDARDVDLVHLADILAHALLMGSNGERDVPALDPVAWARLELDPANLPQFVADVRPQYDDAARILAWGDERGP